MHFVYILYSERFDRLYIGITTNVTRRLAEHNRGSVQSTRPYRPYILLRQEQYMTITEARKREIQIKKSGIIRKHIKQRGPIVPARFALRPARQESLGESGGSKAGG